MAVKEVIGECEFCGVDNSVLYPRRNDLMCQGCIDKENAVTKAESIIAQSQAKDAKIELKSDVMNAATTSFVELQAALQHNPSLDDEARKYALADMAVARIQQIDAAIFAKKQETVELENQKLAWLKNTQMHVATLRQDKQAKYAAYSVNYRPLPPTTKAIKGRSKSDKDVPKGHSNRPISTTNAQTNKQVAEACERYKVDMSTVKMKLMSPSGRNMTAMEAAKWIADKEAN